MPRSPNAQLAVDLYKILKQKQRWDAAGAWKGIAILLLSCEVYVSRSGWQRFHDVVTYVDSNRFSMTAAGPSATLRSAQRLTAYLAQELQIPEQDLCREIAQYWRQADTRNLQPHNLVGNAFRSLTAECLRLFGHPEIDYEEEVDPGTEFPGHVFHTRSRNPKIDIVARKNGRLVSLISVRWRFRHDRLDVVDEAIAYVPALRRQNPRGRFYAVIGEFDGGRLRKLLANSAPEMPNAAISAAVHFAPQLIREGLGENGSLEHLRSLEWLIRETFAWD